MATRFPVQKEIIRGILGVTPKMYSASGSLASVKRGEKVYLVYENGDEVQVPPQTESTMHHRGGGHSSSEGETIGREIIRQVEEEQRPYPVAIRIKRVGTEMNTDGAHVSSGSEEETIHLQKRTVSEAVSEYREEIGLPLIR